MEHFENAKQSKNRSFFKQNPFRFRLWNNKQCENFLDGKTKNKKKKTS